MNRLVELASLAWAEAQRRSAAALADPSTHAALLWLLNLEWWQATLLVLAVFAAAIGTKRVIRWPVLLLIVLFMSTELAFYFSVRFCVYLLERFVFLTKSRKSVRKLQQRMAEAETYDEWKEAAEEADRVLGSAPWKAQPHSRYFNYPLLQSHLHDLRSARAAGDIPCLTATLQTCLHKNTAGIMNEDLYSKTLVGTKVVIEEYIDELLAALEYIKESAVQRVAVAATANGPRGGRNGIRNSSDAMAGTPSRVSGSARRRQQSPAAARSRSTSRQGRSASGKKKRASRASLNGNNGDANYASPVVSAATHALDESHIAPVLDAADVESPHELLRFFQAAKRQFGATALCLSGGASIGNYHWAVVKALLDEGLLPRVISGTSSGAVVAALTCTRTDEELRTVLNPSTLNANLHSFEESWFTCAWRFLRHRCMYDNDKWTEKLQFFANSGAIPKMTFAEAHARTGRILNITCTSQRKHNPSMLLNYLTTPNVCIDTAILASAAVPGFIRPVVLMEKINGQLRPYHDKDLQWCDGSLQRDLPLSELAEMFGVNFYLVSQTNPHIIPWFFNSRGQSGTPSSWRRRTGGYRGGFLLSALELWLKEDMKKNMRVLNQLDLVPLLLGSDFSFLFLQDFQGQVTMVPDASLRDFAKIISDPSHTDLERFMREGRLTAWRKFSMIRNRQLVGNKLSAAIGEIAQAITLAGLDRHAAQGPATMLHLHPHSLPSSPARPLRGGWHSHATPAAADFADEDGTHQHTVHHHPVSRSRRLLKDRDLSLS